jgi:hypothetical protein
MKKYLAAALFLLAFSLANAEGQATRLVQPKGTANDLKLAELKKKEGLLAKFSGQTWISGTFVVQWPAGASAMAYKTPDYKLIPDSASTSKLPHFIISDPPYKNSYKVKDIDIQNGEEALRLTFSAELAKRILERKTDSIRVTGRFLIESYVVGVECDAPWANANLVKADLPDQLAKVHQKVPEGC